MNIFTWPRWKLFLFSAIGLLVLAFFIWQAESGAYEEKILYLQNPIKFQGTEICVGYIKIEKKYSKNVMGRDKHGNVYNFQVEPAAILVNERYSFKGIIDFDGKIHVSSFQHHPFRLFKYMVSALSLGLVLYLMIIHVRFERPSVILSVCNLNKGLFASRRGIGSDA